MGRGKRTKYSKWLETYTKRLVTIIIAICLIDMQLSYVLAFLGKEQIAEALSTEIATTIIGVAIGYFMKALFETFFEEREKRLKKQLGQTDEEE